MNRQPVGGRRHVVADRPDAAQIGNDSGEILRQQRLVEIRRHDRGERYAGQFAVIGRTPSISARLISSSLHAPMPVSLSGVMFGAVARKAGVSKVEPARQCLARDEFTFGIARRYGNCRRP